MLSLRTHNVLDYVAGGLLILLSSAVGNIPAARSLFIWAGTAQIVYSLFTNYRFSIMKLIPLGVHMALDCVAGIMLIAGPSVFGYKAQLSGGQTGLHIAMGVALLGLVILTNKKTEGPWNRIQRAVDTDRAERKMETAGRR